MALTPEGTPYVESTDLVANYPAASLSLANRVDLVGVLPFADSAARTTAIPSPSDGQYSYLQDTNLTEFWNGSAWVGAGTLPGLTLITPTSIANSGGTATATGGTVTFTTVTSVSVNGVFSASYDNYYILVTRTAGSSSSMRMRAAGTDNSATQYEFYGYYGGAAQGNDNISANTSWNIASGSGVAMLSLILVNPFAASISFGVAQLHSVNIGQAAAVVHDVASSFDGFSINGTSQTGTIRVFGYKQT